MAEFVSPAFLSAAATAGLPVIRSETVLADVLVVARPQRTDADRWMDFVDEYGIHERSSSWFLSMIQSAKFGLDKLTFGAKQTAQKLEFTYEIGGPEPSGPRSVKEQPVYSLPLFGKFGQPQLKSVLTDQDRQTTKAFMGLKLDIPFGKGAAEY